MRILGSLHLTVIKYFRPKLEIYRFVLILFQVFLILDLVLIF